MPNMGDMSTEVDDLWLTALREKDAASRRFTEIPIPLLPVAAEEPADEPRSVVDVVKTGVVWIGKAYLAFLVAMVVVLFIVGFLSNPASVFGG